MVVVKTTDTFGLCRQDAGIETELLFIGKTTNECIEFIKKDINKHREDSDLQLIGIDGCELDEYDSIYSAEEDEYVDPEFYIDNYAGDGTVVEFKEDDIYSSVHKMYYKIFPIQESKIDRDLDSENDEISYDKLLKVAEHFKDTMNDEIVDAWDEAELGETGMKKKDAEYFLGHSCKDMSREEIDEEVSEVQKQYYSEGEASLKEIINKFLDHCI